MIPLFVSTVLLSTAPPFNIIPEIADVPVDVSGHEKWGVMLTNFKLKTAAQSPREQTTLNLSYSRTHLYITGEVSSFPLNPTSNMVDRFKATATERDAEMKGEDTVELQFGIGAERSYSVTINALGAIRDTQLTPSTLITWDGDISASASKHDGFWRFRMAIAWDSLGLRPNQGEPSFALKAIRRDSGTGEESYLNETPVQLRLGGNQPYGYPHPFSLPLTANREVPVRVVAPKGSTIAWKRELLRGNTLVTSSSGSGIADAVPYDLLISATPQTKSDGDQERFSVFVDGHPIFQSPTYPSRDARTTLQIVTRHHSTPFTLSCNGSSVIQAAIPERSVSFAIQPGANELLLQTASEELPEIEIETPNGLLPHLPSAWVKVGSSEGLHTYRRLIAYQSTWFSPLYEQLTCEIASGSTQFFLWDGGQLPEWKLTEALTNYRLILELPLSLELVGASGAREGLYHVEKLGEVERAGAAYQRYAISRNSSIRLSEGKEEWLAREARRKDALIFAIRNHGKAGERGKIYYQMEGVTAESATPVTEIANALSYTTLAPLEGTPPKQVLFSLYSRLGIVNDPKLQRELFETFRSAGVNEVFTETRSAIPRELGLRQATFFGMGHSSWVGFRAGTLKLDKLFERHPEAHAIAFDGRKMPTPCLSWLARNDEATPYLKTALDEMIVENPGMSHLFWDYEFPPFPEGIHAYPMFSEFGVSKFKEAYKIEGALTPEIIRDRYADEWVAFTCGEVASISKKLSQVAKTAGLEFTMYSGYHLPYTQRRYNVDWSKVAPALDHAYCGYTRDPELIRSTRESLRGVPLVGGLLAMGPSAPRPTVAAILRTLVHHRGGVLFWYEGGGFDSGTLAPIAAASRLIAAHEEAILKGKDVTEELALPPSFQGQAALLEHEQQLALFLWNEGTVPKVFALSLPGSFRIADHTEAAEVSRNLAPGEGFILSLKRHEP